MSRILKLTCCLFISLLSFNLMAKTHNHFDIFATKHKAVIKLQYKYFEMSRVHFYDLDVAGMDHKNNLVDVYATNKQINDLKNEGLNIEIDWSFKLTGAPDNQYKTPNQIEGILRSFSQTFPEITQLVSIGKSLEGRDIWALKITDNPSQHESDEPSILINSMHHAREVMGPEVALDMAEYLLTNYRSDSKTKHWVNNNEIWIVPMLNVDGNAKVWSGKSMWRKNTRGGYGVDINRNYPFGWKSCNGSSGWKHSQTYRGPKPGSEPETQVLMNLVSTIRPVFDISYHSYSEIVIYPLGCKGKRTRNAQIVEGIGKSIGDLIGYEAGTAWELLYSVDGGDIDWMYGAFGVIPYVIEVNSRTQGFQPSYDQWRDKTVLRNRPAWQHLLTRLDGPGIRGIVKNSRGDFKVKVSKIVGETLASFGEHKSKSDGSFHVVLEPGTYKISISKLGIEKEVTISDKRVNLIL